MYDLVVKSEENLPNKMFIKLKIEKNSKTAGESNKCKLGHKNNEDHY